MRTLKELAKDLIENYETKKKSDVACIIGSIMLRSKMTDFEEIDEANEYIKSVAFDDSPFFMAMAQLLDDVFK